MFVSSHYSGVDTVPKFRNGEYWKKVFGPVFIYLNSASEKSAPKLLWEDAKKQVEVEKWPYEFPGSEDFHKSEQRGSVSGRLLVQDKYVAVLCFLEHFSGYQFWVRADVNGNFFVKNVRTGVYNLYAWVPGFIGDYKSSINITVTSGYVEFLSCRKDGQGSEQATTWQIRFRLDSVHPNGTYKLRVALAAAHLSELQVRFNNPRVQPADFTTKLIGRDNSIARQGIHGLYWLFSIDVDSSWLLEGDNVIFLTQTRCQSPFRGVMYDYIRMEAPAGTVASTDAVAE
ncbi:hypothetical protein BHE74_00026839 [Ensete ventricosum]|nr:hypothetical protein BHE74_00026839 [Ensete ventricosum]